MTEPISSLPLSDPMRQWKQSTQSYSVVRRYVPFYPHSSKLINRTKEVKEMVSYQEEEEDLQFSSIPQPYVHIHPFLSTRLISDLPKHSW